MLELKNYEGCYIDKITKIKNVIVQHNYDSKRIFLKKEVYKVNLDNGDILFLVLKPKKYQNCFNGTDFKLINTKFTKEKVIFEDEI